MNSNTIIFSINDTYAPYLYVCLLSLLEHTQPKDKYGVYILQRNLSQQNKEHILSLAQENFNISFIDMKRFITPSMERKFALTCHFTIETYYRFFLAELFPNTDKALYLDADTLICKNIEELFQIELKKNYLAATRDVGMIYNAKQWNKKDVNYFQDILQLREITDYFQAGVMLVNLRQWREECLQQRLLDCLYRVKTPRFVDQDILNSVCYGRIKFISLNWDYTWHLPFLDERYMQTLPELYACKYKQAQECPYIVHFTGENIKPVDLPYLSISRLWWKYATQSPYFENLFLQMIRKQMTHLQFIKQSESKLRRYKLLAAYSWGNYSKKYAEKYRHLQHKISNFIPKDFI